MGKNISLLGLQWGDEGKGKVVDFLAKDLNAAVRYQGGNNAGHTLIIGKKKIVFHLIPSAICHKNVKCFLGRGVVVNLDALFQEIDEVSMHSENIGDRLVISSACSLIQKYHIKLERLREKSHFFTTIGTTGRGIGAAYEDRVGRRSILISDLYNPSVLETKLEEALEVYNFMFEKYFETDKEDKNQILEENLYQAEKLKPYVGNVIQDLKELQKKGKTILFEGAQGALLDVSLGTYPYVTSSNSSVGGIAVGAGINPSTLDYSLGITKAYTTRVGEGPFPTELDDKVGSYLSKKGGEVGATTGRPRRCGWLDAVLLSHTIHLNGIDGLCLTKLDVLDGLEKIKVCINYDSKRSQEDLLETMSLDKVKPEYIELPGWNTTTAKVRHFDELNKIAKDFIYAIEDLTGVPIIMISTGPRREDTIVRQYPL